MSYTFAICNATLPEGAEGADAWDLVAPLTDEPEPDPGAFEMLIDYLTVRYPCVGHLPREQTGGCECVWGECPRGWKSFTRAMNFRLLRDHIATVLPFVIEAATALGFSVYDWQRGELYRPGGSPSGPRATRARAGSPRGSLVGRFGGRPLTEAEWPACADARVLIHDLLLRRSANGRKARLFACACCLRISKHLHLAETRTALKVLDQFLAGQVPAGDVVAVARAHEQKVNDDFGTAVNAVRFAVGTRPFHGSPVSWMGGAAAAAHYSAWAAAGVLDERRPKKADVAEKARQDGIHADMFRDIFGNPFHPVTFAPSWRTDTVRALAAQMYESRDFSAMPILADALQDAGCDSAEILSHCRGAGPHVRGCWVVDLVLGKE